VIFTRRVAADALGYPSIGGSVMEETGGGEVGRDMQQSVTPDGTTTLDDTTHDESIEPGAANPDAAVADLPTTATDDSKVGYRGTTAFAVAGITYRQLDYWARTGLVVPSVRDASGSGTQRLYSFRDIVVLKVVKRLLDAGVSLQNIRKAIETLRQWGEEDLATMTLISDGTTVYECRSTEEVVDLLQGGQGVFGIAIGGAFKEIQGSLADLPVTSAQDSDAADPSADKSSVDELAARRARRRAG
jgi:DNA-binding transcriptional MerR regulator